MEGLPCQLGQRSRHEPFKAAFADCGQAAKLLMKEFLSIFD